MMENLLMFRLLGLGLILIGVVLVWNPELISNKPVPEDTFAAIERRIWWGLIIGFGILLMFHHQLQPWKTTLAATGLALLLGLLAARLIGIMLDGSVLRQWINVGIEMLMLFPLLWWYLSLRG